MIITELQDWLEAFCDGREGVVEGIIILAGEAGGHAVAWWACSGGAVAEEVHLTAHSALRSRELVVETLQGLSPASSPLVQVLSLPVTWANKAVGALALGLSGRGPEAARNILAQARRSCDSLAPMLALLAGAKVSLNANAALQLHAAVLTGHGSEEAASTFATRLAELLGVDRTSIGFIEHGYAKVVAISHGTALDAGQTLNREVAAAMDEAIDQAATIAFPAAAAGLPRITLAHAELARRHGAATCSVPIVHLGAIVGAVTLERAGDRPLGEREIVLCEHVISLIGPVLALRRDGERPWRSRARQALGAAWARLTGPGELRLKASVAGIALLFAVMFLVPVPYSITAPARLEGSIQRALAAASDGFIQQVSARPGDSVKEGQVLAELAQHDLQLERTKWESELAQQVNAYGAALARADRSLLMVNHAKATEARAQLELIEQQIERAQIKAPFDGIIISGDLTQSLGAPARRGEVLMVIAPQERYRLIVEVDERDIVDLRTGAAGRVSLAASPGQALPFRTERVAPLAATRDGRHFFEVEGKLEGGAVSLRPGLQGVAKLEADDRALVWMLFHRPITWLRLHLWSWGFWQ